MTGMHSKLWHLEQFNMFKQLSMDELMKIDESTTMKAASKNDYVFFPEEPSKSVYFLKKGRIKIGSFSADGKEIIKSILYPGEIFGEMGVIGEDKRKDIAIALDSETQMCVMNTKEFEQMMQSYPNLSLEVTKNIGEKLRKIERRLESLVFKDARERIIDFVKEMATKYGKLIGSEVLVKHNLTHQDMANLTATSRQTVTTVLNELKEKDLLYTERNRFLVREIDKL